MLTVKQIIKVARLNAACGLDPAGDNGSCFGVSEPSRLRPTSPVNFRKPSKPGEKTVIIDLGAIKKARKERES